MVQMNHFYQEYIHNKEHIHMNATRWPSLTEFAKFLGREGICRVEENEKGIHIAWIDNSPDALRRQDAIKKKERMDKGDEEREQKQIEEQIKKAREQARQEEAEDQTRELKRDEGQKISLNFGTKRSATDAKLPTPPRTDEDVSLESKDVDEVDNAREAKQPSPVSEEELERQEETAAPPPPVKLAFSTAANKPKNVFAAAKKNPLASKKPAVADQPKKMSEAERIMKEEMARKQNGFAGQGAMKRQRVI